jgi:hypothetical protein
MRSHLIHTNVKAALDMPLLLLPFRPGLETIGAKNFIRQYFKARYDSQVDPKAFARRELMLMEPIVSAWSESPFRCTLTDVGSLQYHEMVLE